MTPNVATDTTGRPSSPWEKPLYPSRACLLVPTGRRGWPETPLNCAWSSEGPLLRAFTVVPRRCDPTGNFCPAWEGLDTQAPAPKTVFGIQLVDLSWILELCLRLEIGQLEFGSLVNWICDTLIKRSLDFWSTGFGKLVKWSLVLLINLVQHLWSSGVWFIDHSF